MELAPNRPDADNAPARQLRSTTMVLSLLAILFCLRVTGQLVQAIWEVPVIPAFSSWQSGALNYQTLLLIQLAIIALMMVSILTVATGRVFGRLGFALCILGAIYLAAMSLRALIGYFDLSTNAWFDQPVPTAFHFVLAGFVLVLGWFWTAPEASGKFWHQIPRKIAPFVAYPLTVLSALCLFVWLVDNGTSLAFSAYLAVTLGATIIVSHELLCPYRDIWLPSSTTVKWDVAYLVLVQVMFPAVLSLIVVGGISYGLAVLGGFNPVDIWPHHWPLAVQVVLMLLSADLLRYWLHRAAHKVKWLWALHAVHHSPKELYSLNVGRFHPGDKALQFLLDALPFALMGVGPEVLAIYFVFYALNGFFQHSNADVRLGFLNWVIAGPELHRWHHAKAYKLSNCNYGNNLIIWDSLFGTRYLPSEDHVGKLGIGNSSYPEDLIGQTLAPFVSNPDTDTPG